MSFSVAKLSAEVSSDSDSEQESDSASLRRKDTLTLPPSTSADSSKPLASLSSLPSLSKQQSTPLPNFMEDVNVYFHDSVSEETVNKLKRYLVAYDGQIQSSVTTNTSHIVVEEPLEGDGIQVGYSNHVLVFVTAISRLCSFWLGLS